MKKNNLTKSICIVLLTFCTMQISNAQLLKKLKGAATGKTETAATSKGGSKIIGESAISDDVIEDDYGINGIYYAQGKKGITKNKLEFDVCKDFSKAKGAEDLPACLSFKYEIPEDDATIWRDTNTIDEYAHPQNLLANKSLFFPARGMFGAIFLIEDGVLFMMNNRDNGFITGTDAQAKNADFDFTNITQSGTFYVKNKESVSNWSATPEVVAKVKVAIQTGLQNVSDVYTVVESKKNAKNEMPAIGKLNSKFIQDRALKTYKEKYDAINKGWTSNYMYAHGNEWVNKKKYLPNGQLVESHRELHVVIVRTNPQGQCKADLMYYVEVFENGNYNAASGKVTGPVSYIGMPGGYLPCEKTVAFKSKLIK